MHGDSANLLRRHGIHVTAQRLAVLAAVSGRPHATADDVTRGVRAGIGVVSRQAVYDALAILAEHGLIRRIQPSGSPARYEDRTGDNHHHLICRTCGGIVDVDCAVSAPPSLTPATDAGFKIDEAEVIYWGRCPECVAHLPVKPRAAAATGSVPRPPRRRDDSDTDRAAARDETHEKKGEAACQTRPARAR